MVRGRRQEYSAYEMALAMGYLMTGDRAQKPSWAAIRKTIRMLRHYQDLGVQPPYRHVKGGWRTWPKNQGNDLEALHAIA